jgi:hypothetical protein
VKKPVKEPRPITEAENDRIDEIRANFDFCRGITLKQAEEFYEEDKRKGYLDR